MRVARVLQSLPTVLTLAFGAIGVAVVHIAAIVTIAWLLGRLGGPAVVAVGAIPIALLAWNMGSDMLLAARQHQFLLFACLAFLVSAWAAADTSAGVRARCSAPRVTFSAWAYAVASAGVSVRWTAPRVVVSAWAWAAH